MTKGKYDPKSPRLGFHNWSLDTIADGAPELFNQAFKEALDIATEQYEATVYFADVSEVAKITVALPLGAEEYEDPTWEVDLFEVLEDEISLNDDPEDTPRLIALRDRFREMAEHLDKAINNRGKPPD